MNNQFQTIQSWIPQVLKAIKRDIRTDHLPGSPAFFRTHFGHRPINRLTAEEIFAVYEKDLLAGNEELIEWVVNRWVFKHGDLYTHFAERLEKIASDYGSIKQLTEEQSEQILEGAIQRFSALSVYLFSVLNQVVFPETVFTRLRTMAENEDLQQKTQGVQTAQQQNLEEALAKCQKELVRLNEKYEDKLAGVMKKYAADVEALKKQNRALQQRLQTTGRQ
ncbi:MAG: hypothetical protein HY861_01465 [Chlamydiia bacterium]|nr:hypothetical protein [Chlamydiia bacterium]